MLTRCPYCSTTFRVTPEQLKVRQGQVRCGKCRRVFDALRALVEDAPAQAPVPAPRAPEPVCAPSPAGMDGLSWTIVQPAPPGLGTPTETPPDFGFAFVPTREPEAEPEPASEAPAGFEPVADIAPTTDFESPAAAAPDIAATAEAPVEEITIEALPEPLEDLEAESSPLSAQQPQPQVWFEPEREPAPDALAESSRFDPGPPTMLELHEAVPREPIHWPWIMGSTVALILLAGQSLLHFRTELIVAAPELRPAFVTVCELFGCRIELPHRIELLGIESSDLAPGEKGTDTLQLTTMLRNRAPYAQEWPHLEITLTDAQERPLLRRALAPAEYLPAGIALAEGFPARSEQAVQLTLAAPGVAAVGYRIYVFHP